MLDILGGLIGAPLFAALISVPRRWRSLDWFLMWWVLAAAWVAAWSWLASDWIGASAAMGSLGFAAGIWSRLRYQRARRPG